MELKIQIDNRVGDKIIVMSEAQYNQYLADPAAFLSWLERTGRLPEPVNKDKVVNEPITKGRKR